MEWILSLFGGVLIGILLHMYTFGRAAAHGFFTLKQINEDEGVVNMRIPNAADQDLLNKRIIILKKESTQK